MHVWIACLAGLRGMGQQSGDCAGLCRPGGHSLAEWRSCVCVCIISLAGLGGMAWQSGDHAGLCRPGGHSPVEQGAYVCGLLNWQALGSWPGRAEIIQACAGLRAWPSRDHECLWIAGLAGLKGSSGRDLVGLRGGSLG
jgi:hypothetical protein